jgi:hypothetical protein
MVLDNWADQILCHCFNYLGGKRAKELIMAISFTSKYTGIASEILATGPHVRSGIRKLKNGREHMHSFLS